jgi:Na+-transporting methylmalonyl-CoA/oxaloacetate decarboxylase gamma subunit
MTQIEAWFVTLLSLSCVFFGLVLIIGFINIFNRVAKLVKWEAGHAHDQQQHAAPKETSPSKTEPKQAIVPPSPEVLAVISAVLEIEQRLYQGHGSQRLTIRR